MEHNSTQPQEEDIRETQCKKKQVAKITGRKETQKLTRRKSSYYCNELRTKHKTAARETKQNKTKENKQLKTEMLNIQPNYQLARKQQQQQQQQADQQSSLLLRLVRIEAPSSSSHSQWALEQPRRVAQLRRRRKLISLARLPEGLHRSPSSSTSSAVLLVILLCLIISLANLIAGNEIAPQALPAAATCRPSEASARGLGEYSKIDNLIQQSSITMVTIYLPKSDSPNQKSTQSAFESICNGWWVPNLRAQGQPEVAQNLLQALWVLDRVRNCLLVKFLLHDPDQRYHIFLFRASLLSPPFPAPPSYHSMEPSVTSLANSCRFQLSAFVNIKANLEIRLHSESAGVDSNSTVLKTISDLDWGRDPLSSSGKLVWRQFEMVLPRNLRGHFRLELVAEPMMFQSRTAISLGIAVANLSLSDACFGVGVPSEELERLHQLTGSWPLNQPDGPTSQNPSIEMHNSADRTSAGLPVGGSDDNDDRQLLPGRQQTGSQGPPQMSLLLFVGSFVGLISVGWLLLCLLVRSVASNRKLSYSDTTLIRIARHLARWPCCCVWTSSSQTATSGTLGRRPGESMATGCGRLARHKVHVATKDTHGMAQGSINTSGNYLRPLRFGLQEGLELAENPNYLNVDSLQFPPWPNRPLEPLQLNRGHLTLTDPLGKGAFGKVFQGYLLCNSAFLCEPQTTEAVVSISGWNGELEHDTHSIRVAVKTLTEDRMCPEDFVREANNLSLVSHRNIVRLIGVCFEEKPFYIVMELLEGGNLKDFLIKHRDRASNTSVSCLQLSSLANGSPIASPLDPLSSVGNIVGNGLYNPIVASEQQPDFRLRLSQGDLLVFALDIARALDYLHRNHFIHRDVAARNCLLTGRLRAAYPLFNPPSHAHSPITNPPSPLLRPLTRALPSALEVEAQHKVDLETVYLDGFQNSSIVAKLADFGMARDIYNNDTYRMGHKEIPVRWIPPESLDGLATTKSDVWSFGIFLWELFSMGQLPYQHMLDNAQVLDFIKSRRYAKQPATPSPLMGTNQNLFGVQLQPAAGYQEVPSPNREHQQNESQCNNFGQTQCSNQNTNNNNNNNANGVQLRPNSVTDDLLLLEMAAIVGQEEDPPLPPPLEMPHESTPRPIYSIMCACWADNPDERPTFEEIGNRLYWCLQKPDVLNSPLPVFYEQPTPGSQAGRGSENWWPAR